MSSKKKSDAKKKDKKKDNKYCGANLIKGNQSYGSLDDCIDKGQIRFWSIVENLKYDLYAEEVLYHEYKVKFNKFKDSLTASEVYWNLMNTHRDNIKDLKSKIRAIEKHKEKTLKDIEVKRDAKMNALSKKFAV